MFRWYRKYRKRRAAEKSRLAGRQLDELRFQYHAFKNLLINNNDILEHMTRMEMQLQRSQGVVPGLKTNVDKLVKLTLDLVQNLNYLTGGSYTGLFGVLRGISSRLEKVVQQLDPGQKVPLVFPLTETRPELTPIVGGKAAPLGMLKRELGLPVPEGFVITTEAAELFFEENALAAPIREQLRNLDPNELQKLEEVSKKIQLMISNGRIPQTLREAMEKAYERLLEKNQFGSPCGVAVRSSAIPEDGRYSFAGQFATILNVTSKEAFFEAYRKVLASNFNEVSLIYRLHREMGLNATDMAVLCLEMVPARSAGTLYTLDPNDRDGERMILCSIWGLGEYLVNGRLPPDIFHVSRLDPRQFELVHLARKDLKLVCDRERGGTKEEPGRDEDSLRFSLDEEEIRNLCEYGLAIEEFMGVPQDIEWAVTEGGRIFILQSRTLHFMRDTQAPGVKNLEGLKLLMERGATASKGQSTGTLVRVRGDEDIANVKPGSILVAREGSLKMVRRISHLRGIILERGNPLEHLACVAREYRIPMIVKAANAMELLPEGQDVTLDADEARVYQGEAKLPGTARIGLSPGAREEEWRPDPRREEVRSLIFRLNLVDAKDANFQMQSCRSVHDVVRFCHEQAIRAMFEINEDQYSRNKFYASRLESSIPFFVDIINLGGGFTIPGHPRKVTVEEITSIPFLAFWRGVSHEGVRWSGPPPKMNVKALSSVMSNTMIDAVRSGRALGSRTYALVSRDYMNLNSRLAYHFAMVDTLCTNNATDNYINFRFKGGGTGLDRRVLRVRFIARILEWLGFFVNIQQDLLNATSKGLPLGEQEEKLDMMGRLLGCTRLLDMAMDDEETMEWFVEQFKRGNYRFEPGPDARSGRNHSRVGRIDEEK